MMSTLHRGRGSKYTDDFKRKLVAESGADGVSVPMVAKKNGVPDNRVRDKAPFRCGCANVRYRI